VFLEDIEERPVGLQADADPPAGEHLQDLTANRPLAQFEEQPGTGWPRRAVVGLPHGIATGFQQQQLDAPTGVVPPAENARGNDARVVHNEEIAGTKVAGEIGDMTVLDTPRFAVENEHARSGALGQRFLGDQLGGKVEEKVGGFHWQGGTTDIRFQISRGQNDRFRVSGIERGE